ncbi:MAG: Fe-S cluster assembly protein SufD [Lawsonella sp.]
MTVSDHKAVRTYSTNVEDFPKPHGKIEEWRFTPTKLYLPFAEMLPTDQRGQIQYTQKSNGAVNVESAPLNKSAAGCVNLPTERLSAVAWNSSEKAHTIEFPEGDSSDTPLVLEAHDEDSAELSYGHLIIKVPDEAQASLLLYRHENGANSDGVEILVGDNASLTFAVVGLQGDDSISHSEHSIQLGENAHLRHGVINLGGHAVRTNTAVRFAGPRAEVELLGLFFAGPGQHCENRLLVDHDQPYCTSDVNYKGALLGDTSSRDGIAHGVWVGDVFISPEAVGTNTYESNRNLMLSKATRMDSIPNLEITTGVIDGAGHASTTGRFDEEELFYLQSRGIDEVTARQLVVRGFFHDIVHRLELPTLEAELDDVIFKQLDRAGL